jgi:oligopeptidase B
MFAGMRPSVSPPRADERPSTLSAYGFAITDEFAWLKDANWKTVLQTPAVLDPAIAAHLKAESAYADSVLAPFASLQNELFEEMRARIKQDDATVPRPDGPYSYFVRYRQGGQYPLFSRYQGDAETTEQLLLDGDLEASRTAYMHLGGVRHSPDHRLLAWSADTVGSEFHTIRVRDLGSGRDLADSIPQANSSSVVWSADASAFYYVHLDDNHRGLKVFRHTVGTDASSDVLVFEEHDIGFFVGISRLQSGRYAEISAHDHETSESWLIDLHDSGATPFLVAAREPGVQYDVEHHPDLFGAETLVIRTNASGAEDFKLAAAPLASPARDQWRDLVAHREGTFLLSFSLFQDWLVRLEREQGLPRIVIRRLTGGEEHTIAFPEEAYALSLDQTFEFATDTLRFTYSSMTTPDEVWDYDLQNRQRTLRKRKEIPSGHDPAHYVTRRIFAPTADGESVPITLLHRRDLTPERDTPCLLYGYGSYGMAMPASFSANRLSLVDRGFVYAIAHVRGGTENGWRWYREGKLAKKANTFLDFIAAAEQLVAIGWTRPERIIAHGGSAGGMLMGAIANMRPDLFGGIVAEVPFVDVLNTMLDEALPLTAPEWPEWGNPITDPAAFEAILGYSPYENVRPQNYPPMLVMAGIADPRVLYWEPAKWVARLRQRKTDGNVIVFRINMDSGHSGASGRFERLKEVAIAYAFAIAVVRGEWPAETNSPVVIPGHAPA